MSLRILLDDKINKLLKENTDLDRLEKNKFEKAVAAIINVRYLHGIEFDDLVGGMMGDGGDEGIDLCYLFLNGKLIRDKTVEINNQSSVVLKLFQIKKEDSFSTDGFRKFIEGIEEIFNLELQLDKLRKIGANSELLKKVELIRDIFRRTRLENAKFSLECFFATVAVQENYSEKIRFLQDKLRETLKIYSIEIKFHYWTAQHLLDFTSSEDEKVEFEFEGQPLIVSDRDVDTSGYVGFVNGNKLMEVLVDETGRFKDELTDGNIRFFLGEDKQINKSIIDTALSSDKSKNFWAMNNGITIIGENLTPSTTNSIVVQNPDIVNGCQTVHCLYNAYRRNEEEGLPQHLKVFVKLVKTGNSEANSEIISATNSQNHVKSISLKANETIQRNIENHLIKYDIYYERRENYYKRQGKSGLKVISLERLTQIMYSIINREPTTAINDTATIIDSENKYSKLFHEKVDYDIYRFGADLYLKTWSFKNSDIRSGTLEKKNKDIISKGGYLLITILSSLIISDAEFTQDKVLHTKIFLENIDISKPQRKNEFSIRKNSIFLIITDDHKFGVHYANAKTILFNAIQEYEEKTNRNYANLFKFRGFDKEYLTPAIEKFLNGSLT